MGAKHQRGFSMVEILVAVLVLAIGLLGVAGVQVLSLQHATNADARTKANLMANELGERARVDQAAIASYVSSRTDQCPANGVLADWCSTMQRYLPGAEFEVAWNAASRTLDIELWWYERQMFGRAEAGEGEAEGAALGGEAMAGYAYQVRY